ncbi:hypothetical protein FQZ97_970610 [compost metagenome]
MAGRFQADAFDIASRSHAQFLDEHPRQRARRHVRLGGQRLQRQVVTQVRGNPLQQSGQTRHPAWLGREQGAELGLPTRPAQEHHQAPRHRQCGDTAEVGFDQGQGQVDTRGDARRGKYMAIAVQIPRVIGVQAVREYLDVRIIPA